VGVTAFGADGVAGEVEFRDSFFFGVFAALRDPAAFAQVRCEHGCGPVASTSRRMRCTRRSGSAAGGCSNRRRAAGQSRMESTAGIEPTTG